MPAQSIHAFAEKVALITDGTTPIGRAAALQLALLGCYVIVGIGDSSAENLSALTELKNLGTLANAVETDISTVAGAKSLVGEVEKLFGRLDLLINTTTFTTQKQFEEVEESDWTTAVDRNLKSVFFVTQSAIALMKNRPKPAIVNVISACDTGETAENSLFAETQSALAAMTRSLALKFAPKFRVNAVAVSEKKISQPVIDAELFKPKMGFAADDAARTIVYLLSSEAVGLNGQILTVG